MAAITQGPAVRLGIIISMFAPLIIKIKKKFAGDQRRTFVPLGIVYPQDVFTGQHLLPLI